MNLDDFKLGTLNIPTSKGWIKWVPMGDLTIIGSPEAVAASPIKRHYSNPSVEEGKLAFRKKQKPSGELARLLVGFNVGGVPRWDKCDLYLMTYLLREKQVGSPGFTLFAGLGAYAGAKGVIQEKSAQIVILNFGTPRDEFFDQMFDLAGALADNLNQDDVLLQLQEEGVQVYGDFITSKPGQRADVEATLEVLSDNLHRIDTSFCK